VDFFVRRQARPPDIGWVSRIRRPAHAYLDAGTGAMIFQMLIAAILGIGVFWKTLWWRVKRLLGQGAADESACSSEEPSDDD